MYLFSYSFLFLSIYLFAHSTLSYRSPFQWFFFYFIFFKLRSITFCLIFSDSSFLVLTVYTLPPVSSVLPASYVMCLTRLICLSFPTCPICPICLICPIYLTWHTSLACSTCPFILFFYFCSIISCSYSELITLVHKKFNVTPSF